MIDLALLDQILSKIPPEARAMVPTKPKNTARIALSLPVSPPPVRLWFEVTDVETAAYAAAFIDLRTEVAAEIRAARNLWDAVNLDLYRSDSRWSQEVFQRMAEYNSLLAGDLAPDEMPQ